MEPGQLQQVGRCAVDVETRGTRGRLVLAATIRVLAMPKDSDARVQLRCVVLPDKTEPAAAVERLFADKFRRGKLACAGKKGSGVALHRMTETLSLNISGVKQALGSHRLHIAICSDPPVNVYGADLCSCLSFPLDAMVRPQRRRAMGREFFLLPPHQGVLNFLQATDGGPEPLPDVITMDSVIPGEPPLTIHRQPSFDDHVRRQREELLVRRAEELRQLRQAEELHKQRLDAQEAELRAAEEEQRRRAEEARALIEAETRRQQEELERRRAEEAAAALAAEEEAARHRAAIEEEARRAAAEEAERMAAEEARAEAARVAEEEAREAEEQALREAEEAERAAEAAEEAERAAQAAEEQALREAEEAARAAEAAEEEARLEALEAERLASIPPPPEYEQEDPNPVTEGVSATMSLGRPIADAGSSSNSSSNSSSSSDSDSDADDADKADSSSDSSSDEEEASGRGGDMDKRLSSLSEPGYDVLPPALKRNYNPFRSSSDAAADSSSDNEALPPTPEVPEVASRDDEKTQAADESISILEALGAEAEEESGSSSSDNNDSNNDDDFGVDEAVVLAEARNKGLVFMPTGEYLRTLAANDLTADDERRDRLGRRFFIDDNNRRVFREGDLVEGARKRAREEREKQLARGEAPAAATSSAPAAAAPAPAEAPAARKVLKLGGGGSTQPSAPAKQPSMKKKKGPQPTAADVGKRVVVRGYKCIGTLRYYGTHKVHVGSDRCGVELDKPIGKNDGNVGGHAYFTCRPKHGVLCVPDKVNLVIEVPKDPQPVHEEAPTVTAPPAAPPAVAGSAAAGGWYVPVAGDTTDEAVAKMLNEASEHPLEFWRVAKAEYEATLDGRKEELGMRYLRGTARVKYLGEWAPFADFLARKLSSIGRASSQGSTPAAVAAAAPAEPEAAPSGWYKAAEGDSTDAVVAQLLNDASDAPLEFRRVDKAQYEATLDGTPTELGMRVFKGSARVKYQDEWTLLSDFLARKLSSIGR